MDHGLELIIPRLEILEIEVCNMIYNPGNIGKRIFFNSVLSWKYWKFVFSIFLISWKYWKYDVCWFFWFFQKRRAPKFHAGCTDGWAEISHMRPIQGQKQKLCFTLFSHYFRIIFIFLGIWYFVYAQYRNDITNVMQGFHALSRVYNNPAPGR